MKEMKKLAFVILLLLCFAHESKAQFGGCGPGFCTASPVSGAIGCTPTCPGDILTYKVFYGFRCYSFAYSGAIADIVDTATGNTTGTRLTCSLGIVDNLSSGSACTFVTGNACSDLSTTCAVACKLVTWYDQSGTNACTSSVPCNLTQATNANRPDISLSPAICSSYSAGEGMQAANAFIAGATQPFTVTSIFNATTGGSARSAFGNVSQSVIFGQEFSPGKAFAFAGSAAEASVPVNLWHAIVDIVNGASTSVNIDGVMTSGLGAGAASFDGTVATGVDTFSAFAGPICELGLATGDHTALISTLNTNMHAAYGGWPSQPIASGCTPTCPGDVVAFADWVGFRCYSFAYSGSVADITDSATGNTTGTRLKCSGGTVSAVVSGSACTFVTGNACSSLATTCAVACNLEAWYDQSGANSCSGGIPCDRVQATNASRAPILLNALGTVACGNFGPTLGMQAGAALSSSFSQPFTVVTLWDVTGGGGTRVGYGNLSADSPLQLYGQEFSAGNAVSFAGAVAQTTATTGAFHAIISVMNGASTSITVDGSTTSSLSGGTGAFGGTLAVGQNAFASFIGPICETGLIAGDQTSLIATLNTDMHAAYGGL